MLTVNGVMTIQIKYLFYFYYYDRLIQFLPKTLNLLNNNSYTIIIYIYTILYCCYYKHSVNI